MIGLKNKKSTTWQNH